MAKILLPKPPRSTAVMELEKLLGIGRHPEFWTRVSDTNHKKPFVIVTKRFDDLLQEITFTCSCMSYAVSPSSLPATCWHVTIAKNVYSSKDWKKVK